MYGLIQRHVRGPRSDNRLSMPGGSGKTAGSHSKSHQWNSRIQNVSKWNTLSGRSRAAIPSTNSVTVASSYGVVKDVVSQSPKDQAGGRAARPVSAVYLRSTSAGVGPYTIR